MSDAPELLPEPDEPRDVRAEPELSAEGRARVCDWAITCANDLLSGIEDRPAIETIDEWRAAVAQCLREGVARATQEQDRRIDKLRSVLELANKNVQDCKSKRDAQAARIAELTATIDRRVEKLRATEADLRNLARACEAAIAELHNDTPSTCAARCEARLRDALDEADVDTSE